MYHYFRGLNRALEKRFGLTIKRLGTEEQELWRSLLEARQILSADCRSPFLRYCLDHLAESQGQLFQDLFVLHELSEKTNGFFVEFGATNGKSLSNTFLLEKKYGWTGILAEPAKAWHSELQANRSCAIDHRCVAERTGDLVSFNETELLELSTIDKFSSNDARANERASGKRYEVQTVSLNDLLSQHDAPADIDYLSVDTEGSELSILQNLDFVRYKPKIVTVEHNFVTNARSAINALLAREGYIQKYPQFSIFDDWYVRGDQQK
ncbi:FkbM family methyltransferase [Bradyrhizobium sp. CW10]|uniref:FkbM family methyltransferase n=1 Tax=Bradyrhizobium sp. CW10 TaxID=2782683 RepID=UPI001FFA095E|nr:FkbM family methyltransferase [Bradyrhizobium sp. CW10]MCK1468417.1 FkbM family methyltransferase [Bradyrhizobium sp. CW10]